MQRRGAGAWERVAHTGLPPGRAEGGVNLLHVHAVQDATNTQAYIPAVETFLREARQRGWCLDTVGHCDRALADMLAVLCYAWCVGIQQGRYLVAGFQHIYPEYDGKLPEAERALKAWERFGTVSERDPICVEAWAAVLVAFLRCGDPEGALITALSFDCLFRGQDWFQLQVADVSSSHTSQGALEVAIALGVRSRGESVKTGFNQGVVVERLWIARWLLAFRERRIVSGDRVLFSVTRDEFRTRFQAHQQRLGIDLGPPHILRHGGAAEMIAQKQHPNTVKRRGRWVTDSSLRRYTKTHVLTAQRASLPSAVLDLGRLFLADPVNELHRAHFNVLDPR